MLIPNENPVRGAEAVLERLQRVISHRVFSDGGDVNSENVLTTPRYILTEMKANADPQAAAREQPRAAREVATTKRGLNQNGAR